MRIVFMGTPSFAVNSLEALYNAGHEIVGVFTQPDKPQGRKMVLTAPPVKEFARLHGLKVYQPNSVKTDEAFDILQELKPDIIVVVAYGKLLPERILNLAQYGCVNGHASILPRHRGASPIQWSIYCGDKVTGVTTMKMDIGMDTGDMLLCDTTDILPNDNFETLHDRLAQIGADLMVKTLKGLEEGTITPEKQPEDNVSYAPIIKKEMGQLDFSKSASKVDCHIRAFTPWPSAFFFLNDKRVKVISAVVGENTVKEPGMVIGTKDGITVACGEGTSIVLKELQIEGKSKMTAKDFLNGYNLPIGTVL